MPRSTVLLLALATLSASPVALVAQDANVAGSGNPSYSQSQSAPIERDQPQNNAAPYQNGYPQNRHDASSVINSQPEQGVLLRYERKSSVHTVSTDAGRTELRVDRGIANVDVYNPVTKGLILVDLPGGQVQLVKNGLYTFNADTNTVRVMHGEADAFPASAPGAKPIKVKENHQVSFVGNNIHSTSFDDYQAGVDLLPLPQSAYATGNGEPYRGGYGPYGDGYYNAYPYFAYGYPFWGYEYPFGLGFGYGGFYRGGFYRGGAGFYGGGFRGGGFGGGGFHGGGGGGGRR